MKSGWLTITMVFLGMAFLLPSALSGPAVKTPVKTMGNSLIFAPPQAINDCPVGANPPDCNNGPPDASTGPVTACMLNPPTCALDGDPSTGDCSAPTDVPCNNVQ